MKSKFKFIIIPLLMLALPLVSPAQEKETAFQEGEQMVYIVSYKIGFINTDIAEVRFRTYSEELDGVSAYRINAVAEVYPVYSYFFDMRDEYNTWLRKSDMKPIYCENDIKEGSYRGRGSMTYNWDSMKVDTWWNNIKRGTDAYRTLDLLDESYDGLALFYNLRNTALQDIKDGFLGAIDLLLNDKIKHLEYKFLGREVRKIAKLGKFNTIKFSCQLTTSEAESFADGSEFYMWLSDDDNKIPVYLETPIRVGSVKARLSSYKNMKYSVNKK